MPFKPLIPRQTTAPRQTIACPSTDKDTGEENLSSPKAQSFAVLYRDRKQSKSTRWKGDGILHVFDSGLARLENDDGESMGHAQKLGSLPLEEGTLLFMGDWQLQIVARSAPLSANTPQGGEPRTTVSDRRPYNSPIGALQELSR
jgi:hypothetical protein